METIVDPYAKAKPKPATKEQTERLKIFNDKHQPYAKIRKAELDDRLKIADERPH